MANAIQALQQRLAKAKEHLPDVRAISQTAIPRHPILVRFRRWTSLIALPMLAMCLYTCVFPFRLGWIASIITVLLSGIVLTLAILELLRGAGADVQTQYKEG